MYVYASLKRARVCSTYVRACAYHVGAGVEAQGLVVSPVHGPHLERQRAQVRLINQRAHKL